MVRSDFHLFTSANGNLLRGYRIARTHICNVQSCCERLASADIDRCTAMKFWMQHYFSKCFSDTGTTHIQDIFESSVRQSPGAFWTRNIPDNDLLFKVILWHRHHTFIQDIFESSVWKRSWAFGVCCHNGFANWFPLFFNLLPHYIFNGVPG